MMVSLDGRQRPTSSMEATVLTTAASLVKADIMVDRYCYICS